MKYIIKNVWGKYWLAQGEGVTDSRRKAFEFSDAESKRIIFQIGRYAKRIKVSSRRPSKRKGKK